MINEDRKIRYRYPVRIVDHSDNISNVETLLKEKDTQIFLSDNDLLMVNGPGYIVLDFGNVIVTPTTGNWFITPKFLELVDTSKIDIENLKIIMKDHQYLLGEKLITLEEEFDMFTRYYTGILKDLNYPNYQNIAKEIAKNRTYNTDKYTLCPNIVEELSNLSKKYKLLMLSDNWPCVIPYLKEYNLYDFFDKIYVSSVYGEEKKDKVFFDYPIKDYSIKNGEALFIDDNESLLDIAKEKGFDCLLMDRKKEVTNSKYKIINDLTNL